MAGPDELDFEEMQRKMYEMEDRLNTSEAFTSPKGLPAESDHYVITDFKRDDKDVKRIISFKQKSKDSGIIIDYVLQEDNSYEAVSVEWPGGQIDSLQEDVKTQTETGEHE